MGALLPIIQALKDQQQQLRQWVGAVDQPGSWLANEQQYPAFYQLGGTSTPGMLVSSAILACQREIDILTEIDSVLP